MFPFLSHLLPVPPILSLFLCVLQFSKITQQRYQVDAISLGSINLSQWNVLPGTRSAESPLYVGHTQILTTAYYQPPAMPKTPAFYLTSTKEKEPGFFKQTEQGPNIPKLLSFY